MTNSKVKQADILQQTHTTTGTASAYELNIPKLDALTDEQVFFVQFHITNNATASLNINSLGAVAITTSEWNAIWAGDLKTTGRYTLVYDADTASFIVSEMVDSEVEDTVENLIISWWIINNFNDTIPLLSAAWAVEFDWTYYYIIDWWTRIRKYDLWFNHISSLTTAAYSMIYNNWFLYVLDDASSLLKKINTTTMLSVNTLSIYGSRWQTIMWWYLYVNWYVDEIIKVDMDTLTIISNSTSWWLSTKWLTNDWTYLYWRNDDYINKIDISYNIVWTCLVWTFVDQIEHDDWYIYITQSDDIYKINTTTMIKQLLISNVQSPILITNNYLYWELNDWTSVSKEILKIDKTTWHIKWVNLQATTPFWYKNWRLFASNWYFISMQVD